jgi:hypothetical protein
MFNKPIRFINEHIEVMFDHPPALEKKSGCPNGFKWQNQEYKITDRIAEWHDYQRKGRMARNMSPAHAAIASRRGSWGVGQDYYRVLTDTGRIYDIYYDRAPQDSERRKGEWFIYQELSSEHIADLPNP